MMTTEEKLNLRRAMRNVAELYLPKTLFNPSDTQLIRWKMNQGLVSANMIQKPKYQKEWLKDAREQVKLALLS